jgi:hypothetical protein
MNYTTLHVKFFICVLLCKLVIHTSNTAYGQSAVHLFAESLVISNCINDSVPLTDDQNIINKYSHIIKVDSTEITNNIDLYRNIERWMGTKHLWGGCDKNGIDASCFVQTLYKEVYSITLERSANKQFLADDIDLFKNVNELKLGDLVFFKTHIQNETKSMPVTHVGFYLGNGFFVQSSSSGVNIAKLTSGFWKHSFVAAGRMPAFTKLKGYNNISK